MIIQDDAGGAGVVIQVPVSEPEPSVIYKTGGFSGGGTRGGTTSVIIRDDSMITPTGTPQPANIPQSALPAEEQTIRTFVSTAPINPFEWLGQAISNTFGWIGSALGNVFGFLTKNIAVPVISGIIEPFKVYLIIGVIIVILVLIGYIVFKAWLGAKFRNG